MLAGVACVFAGLKAWPDMKGNELLSLGSLLFYFLVVAVVVSVALLFRRAPTSTTLNGLYIHCARYGHPRCFADVTDVVRSSVKKGRRLEMVAANSTLGVDPAKQENKHLILPLVRWETRHRGRG